MEVLFFRIVYIHFLGRVIFLVVCIYNVHVTMRKTRNEPIILRRQLKQSA